MSKAIEVPLPSGIFCMIRPVRWIDTLIAHGAGAKASDGEGFAAGFFLSLTSRCCTFDGEELSMERLRDLDPQDGSVIINHLGKFMSGPIKPPEEKP